MPDDSEYNDKDDDDHQWYSNCQSNLFLESAAPTFFVLILKSTKSERHLGENCFHSFHILKTYARTSFR